MEKGFKIHMNPVFPQVFTHLVAEETLNMILKFVTSLNGRVLSVQCDM